MTAPVAGSAKVSANGTLSALGIQPTPDEVVTPESAQDPAILAQILGRLLKKVADLNRQWSPRNVDYEDVAVGSVGTITRVQHALAGRVRWWVNGWKTSATPTTDNLLCLGTTWMMRGLWGAGTLATVAGNFTTGVRFQATSPCSIMGARFLWSAATKTVKATLWRDSDGAILGTGTVSVSNTGVYTVLFATPVVPDLNADLTLGIYDQAGTNYTRTAADAIWDGYMPLTLPGMLLKTVKLFLAGDNRPTSTAAAEHYWVEPLLTPAVPQIVEDSSSTNDRLVLVSYAPGTATVRVEESG
jgi:hypothetical protein